MKENTIVKGKVILTPSGYAITVSKDVIKNLNLSVDDEIIIENLTYSVENSPSRKPVIKRGLVLRREH